MNTCKYCNKEITKDGDFCGNCGFINFYDEESSFQRLMKQFKYIFINPAAFIRTSILENLNFTGLAVIMIIIFELLMKKEIEMNFNSNFQLDIFSSVLGISSGKVIVATLAIPAIQALIMFGIVMYIFKKEVKFISFLNLNLSIQLVLLIISVIGTMLGMIISPYLVIIFYIFGVVISLLLLYQGIEYYLKEDIIISLITVIVSIAGTDLITYVAAKSILDSMISRAINLAF